MKNNLIVKVSASALLLCLQLSSSAQKQEPDSLAGPVGKWPVVIPARISDPSGDMFMMTLGTVSTPVAQGTYDPVKDKITLNNGTVIDHYYRDSLHLKYYTPIDKSVFPLPPSGFCTWYYYYQDINENEVKRNTDWLAENLLQYGAKYIQIDDGWQAEQANGKHGSRDWTGIDKEFPSGMADLTKYIRSKGFIPGLWIAPHGQSNEKVVKANPGAFILKPDGSSASKTWEGDWLLDPTSPRGKKYFHDLFAMMVNWGYDYFKIDGQPIVVEEYAKNSDYMHVKGGAADSLYRTTLDIIREEIGPSRYLLGCWGLPVEGAGIMNGSRTGGDVVLGWDGFMSALSPTMESYYQHNIMWYTDPDVMLLRQPFTTDQARVWATLEGLTGQALMSSDRLMDLPDDRVDMMKKVFPATDIRPLDLFPSNKNKSIWDLKVNHLSRSYDVVGLFNFKEGVTKDVALDWKSLGIENGPVHVYDFWNNEFMGTWDAGISLTLNPTSCRVLTLLPDNGEIQLISTSRHITQGWVDLIKLSSQDKGTKISGTSRIPGSDPYKLSFVFPRGKNYRINSVSASDGNKKLAVKVSNHQGWATVEFTAEELSDVNWNVAFEPADSYNYVVRQPEGLEVTSESIDAVRLSWQSQYYLNAGYQVYIDSTLVGYTPGNSYVIKGLEPQRTYIATVRSVWDDGTINKKPANSDRREYDLRFIPSSLFPASKYLSSLEYKGMPEWFSWQVTALGKHYENSIGMMAGASRDYDIKGLFKTLTAKVCVDDRARAGNDEKTIEFIVSADGKEIWNSGPVKRGDVPKELSISVSGVQHLTLSVKGNDEDMFRGLPGDWIEARLER